eukprot:5362893-Prymnesium_polylepis.2
MPLQLLQEAVRADAHLFEQVDLGVVLQEDDRAPRQVVVEASAEAQHRVRLSRAHVRPLDAVHAARGARPRRERPRQLVAVRAFRVDQHANFGAVDERAQPAQAGEHAAVVAGGRAAAPTRPRDDECHLRTVRDEAARRVLCRGQGV